MLSRSALENHFTNNNSIVKSLSSNLTDAVSLFYAYPSVACSLRHVLDIILWMGRLPRFRSNLENIISTGSPTATFLTDVLLPMIDSQWREQLLQSAFPASPVDPDCVEIIVKAVNLLNYLMFVKNGDYRRMEDRVLNIRYKNKATTMSSMPSPPNYYYMFEKHLIRSLCRLLHKTLPIIRRSWPYRKILRNIYKTEELGICCACGKKAVNVVWSSCGHLHCYSCLSDLCGFCDQEINKLLVFYP